MRSSTVAAVLVFVVSGSALGTVLWHERAEEAARTARVEAERRQATEQAAAAARAAEDAERRRFLAMTDAEHIGAARAAIAAGRGDEARRHLTAVTPAASAEANRLLADLGRSEGRAQARAARDAERASRDAEARRRDGVASALDEELVRQHGIDARVRADGTVLRVTYIFCSRVFGAQRLESHFDDFRAAGFTRVECSSGHGERTTWDL